MQAQIAPKYPRIELDVRLSKRVGDPGYPEMGASEPIELKYQ